MKERVEENDNNKQNLDYLQIRIEKVKKEQTFRLDLSHIHTENEIKPANNEDKGGGRHKGRYHDFIAQCLHNKDGFFPHTISLDPGIPDGLDLENIEFLPITPEYLREKNLIYPGTCQEDAKINPIKQREFSKPVKKNLNHHSNSLIFSPLP